MAATQVDSWIRVCDADSVSPDEGTVLTVEPPVTVWNVDGELYATDDTCTHENFSLGESYQDGCQVECALHWAKFDLRTGESITMGYRPLRTYPVRVTDGVVLVDLSGRDAARPGGTEVGP